jgi:hypothetical protein
LQVGGMVLGSAALIWLVTKMAKGGTAPPPPPPPPENGTVSGTILDGVSAFGGTGYTFTGSDSSVKASGFTNSAGAYSVSLPPDTYTYLFWGTTEYQTKHGAVAVSAGADITLSVQLVGVKTPPPDGVSQLSVRVVDAATGLPIAGAFIALRDYDGYNPWVYADANGNYYFAMVNDGPCAWYVSADGYVTQQSAIMLAPDSNSLEVRLVR